MLFFTLLRCIMFIKGVNKYYSINANKLYIYETVTGHKIIRYVLKTSKNVRNNFAVRSDEDDRDKSVWFLDSD